MLTLGASKWVTRLCFNWQPHTLSKGRGLRINVHVTRPAREDQLRNSANYVTEPLDVEGESEATETTDEILLARKVDQRDGCTHFTAALGMKAVFFFFLNCFFNGYLEHEIMSSRPESRSLVFLLQRWSRNGMWPVQRSKCSTRYKPTHWAQHHFVYQIVKGWFPILLLGNITSFPKALKKQCFPVPSAASPALCAHFYWWWSAFSLALHLQRKQSDPLTLLDHCAHDTGFLWVSLACLHTMREQFRGQHHTESHLSLCTNVTALKQHNITVCRFVWL